MPNIVRNYTGKCIQKGGTVRIYGAGFSSSTCAWLDDEQLSLNDYDYGFAEFVGSYNVGTYTLYVGSGLANRSAVGRVSVREYVDLPLHRPCKPSKSEVAAALLGLLPRGVAWYKGSDGVFAKLMRGLAPVVMKVYDLAVAFKESSSPLHTDSFSEWERELKLPLNGLEQSTDAGRKSEIVRVACKKGGSTIPYLRSLLDLYGARYDLYEYFESPSVFPEWVAEKNGDRANYFILVKVYRDSYGAHGMNCKSPCNASLGTPRDSKLESILEKSKPAHIKIIYSYVVKILTDMNGNPIVDDNNRMIIV